MTSMTHSIAQDDQPCTNCSCERCAGVVDRESFAEALEECLDDASGKWETIALALRVDVSLLSKWTGSHKNPMPAWRLIAFTKKVGPGLLRWIAKQCGYNLVRIEKASSRLAS